jgi:hypothetical protein
MVLAPALAVARDDVMACCTLGHMSSGMLQELVLGTLADPCTFMYHGLPVAEKGTGYASPWALVYVCSPICYTASQVLECYRLF